MDESSKQQVKEVRTALAARPGQPECYDSEYERNGVSNLFLFFEPLSGQRHITVTDQRTAVDWAYQIRELVDIDYPDAERIVLVMDNLNTHKPASLYKAFAPEEAQRILQRLEIHYTPKHGSWLNMAEIEFSILSKQCLDRRIPDQILENGGGALLGTDNPLELFDDPGPATSYPRLTRLADGRLVLFEYSSQTIRRKVKQDRFTMVRTVF